MNMGPNSRNAVSVLVIGNHEHWEFCDCLRALKDKASCRLIPFESINQLGDDFGTVDAIVAFQTRPGELSHDLFQHLQKVAPLSPVVMVLGSWCEGEMRSGFPPEGVLRFYWHQFEAHWFDFVTSMASDSITNWHCPATMTHADRLLERLPICADYPVKVAVYAKQPWNADAMVDACSAIGYSVTLIGSTQFSDIQSFEIPCDVFFYDDDGFSVVPFLQLSKFEKPIVVASGYPRKFEIESFFEDAVFVPKPYGLVELKHAIESAFGRISSTETITNDNC